MTVGNVDIAPFDIEYGSGHNRIMISSLSPSRWRTDEKASNRLSFATSRCTNPEKIVRDVKKEHVDPATVAVAMMSQPSGSPYTKPARVKQVEYPTIGGNAVMNVIAHSIHHPPLRLFHFIATGSSQVRNC